MSTPAGPVRHVTPEVSPRGGAGRSAGAGVAAVGAPASRGDAAVQAAVLRPTPMSPLSRGRGGCVPPPADSIVTPAARVPWPHGGSLRQASGAAPASAAHTGTGMRQGRRRALRGVPARVSEVARTTVGHRPGRRTPEGPAARNAPGLPYTARGGALSAGQALTTCRMRRRPGVPAPLLGGHLGSDSHTFRRKCERVARLCFSLTGSLLALYSSAVRTGSSEAVREAPHFRKAEIVHEPHVTMEAAPAIPLRSLGLHLAPRPGRCR